MALCQDLSAAAGTGPPAAIYQFGIIRSSAESLKELELLEVPTFVHSRLKEESSTIWLEFSALYVVPPQATTRPLTLQVHQLVAGKGAAISAWYPYAVTQQNGDLIWENVLVGVQADCLQTTSLPWMTARAVETAATLKVYKHGPPGSIADDAGTTEGETFLFVRGHISAAPPLAVEIDQDENWIIRSATEAPASISPEKSAAWLVRTGASGEILHRQLQLTELSKALISTTAPMNAGFHGQEADLLRGQISEVAVGNGMQPDQTAALADVLMQVIAESPGSVLLYMLPDEWVEEHFPLTVTGAVMAPRRLFFVVQHL